MSIFEIRHFCQVCGIVQTFVVVKMTNWTGVRCAKCGSDHDCAFVNETKEVA